ncbi:hypothetical protein DMP14_06025 [Pseudonocardia sp. Ae707_Ps2]|uniref:hypothetical protein n=1 Tax=Pseudonocardia sp. Ae707_Ps2 TaxID=2212992 RepID=UPI00307CDBEB
MNHDNRDDQTGRGKDSGGASPTHHDREDALAPVITLHHHTDTSTTDTGSPVVVEGEVISSSAGGWSPVRSRAGALPL